MPTGVGSSGPSGKRIEEQRRDLVLPDARRLCYAEYGRPNGAPLIYCHGFPASRLEAALWEDVALRNGIRLIGVDRPGLGLSDFQPGRSIADWPRDLAALADALELERFAVLGLSGGGPYALSCARKLPERLMGVGVVCGLAPLVGTRLLEGMDWQARHSFSFMARVPQLAGPFYRHLIGPLFGRFPALTLAALTGDAPAADREALNDDKIRQTLIASMAEAFRRGGRGAAYELELLGSPWGFDLEDITLPVLLWHGEADRTVPAEHGRWVAERLRDCRARFIPGEGHFSLPLRHGDGIIRAVFGLSDSGKLDSKPGVGQG